MKDTLVVTFSVLGHVTQKVRLVDVSFSAEHIQEMLNDGTAVTTIQENGDLVVTESGHVIAKVVGVDNECEYSDFNVEPEEAF